MAPIARAQTVTAQTTDARREIQVASDALNAALKRGDAAGALRWLAPNFTLGERQYRVRDLDWMKTALPLQLQRARFTELSAAIGDVTLSDGIARIDERINAEAKLKPGVKRDGPLENSGIEGAGNATWKQTAQGWRLQRANGTLEVLLFAAAPPADLAAQMPVAAPDSTAAAVGLALQEPLAVLERRGGFESALAFSPDSNELAFSYDAEKLVFAAMPTGATAREITVDGGVGAMAYSADGSLWTSDSGGHIRQREAASGAVKNEWQIAPQYSYFTWSVAPDGHNFAVGQNNRVQLWNAQTGRPREPTDAVYPNLIGTRFSPDSARLAVIYYEGTELREVATGALIAALPGDRFAGFGGHNTVTTMKLAFASTLDREREADVLRFRAPDLQTIEREIALPAPWSGAQQALREVMDAQGTVTLTGYFTLPAPVLAPDRKQAASVFYDGSIGVWDTRNGVITRMLRGFNSARDPNPPTLLFSPDSRLLAVSHHSGEIAVWDVSAPNDGRA